MRPRNQAHIGRVHAKCVFGGSKRVALARNKKDGRSVRSVDSDEACIVVYRRVRVEPDFVAASKCLPHARARDGDVVAAGTKGGAAASGDDRRQRPDEDRRASGRGQATTPARMSYAGLAAQERLVYFSALPIVRYTTAPRMPPMIGAIQKSHS